MPFISLEIPPGMVRPGTKYDARGRWFDGNLVRWHENAMKPVGGWDILNITDPTEAPIVLGDPVRGMLAWRDNAANPVLALGTSQELWAFTVGALSDITPVGFTTGGNDAVLTSGQYGFGAYGSGAFGFGVEGQSTITEANSWQLDIFGQFLVACAYSDGDLYLWDLTSSPATQMTGSPTNCGGVVVTPERFVVALAADGDQRAVAWSDQGDPNEWAAGRAGDFVLASPGGLQAGRRGRGETLLWTDQDMWAMRFVGGTLVYGFTQLGSECGAISRHSMVIVDGKAFWMGRRGFYTYDGFVRTIASDVADYVFGSLNRLQASKIAAYSRAQFAEVTWHYPSAESTENDRYVSYNWLSGHWTIGELERTSGVDAGAFGFPIAADAGGTVYQHEIVNGEYLDPDDNPLAPFAESGPIELGRGDHGMIVRQIVPDASGLGDVNAHIYSSFYPVQNETLHGPFSLANPTSVRLSGRQVRFRVDQVTPNWRVGTMRLEVVPTGRR